jgi:hypothetical protein
VNHDGASPQPGSEAERAPVAVWHYALAIPLLEVCLGQGEAGRAGAAREMLSTMRRLSGLLGDRGHISAPPRAWDSPSGLGVDQALDLVAERWAGPGSWTEERLTRGMTLRLRAHLCATGTLDLRRMHPVVLEVALFEACYVPAQPDLEPGVRNARRLGEMLARLEHQAGCELFGIESPLYPRQACSWGFLVPHTVPRSC